MKKLVWLLVLINVGLLVYFNKDVILPSAPKAALLAIHPEKISIVNQQQIDALPKKGTQATVPPTEPITPPTEDTTATVNATPAPEPTPTKTACYEWGVFSATNLTGAQAAVSKLSLQPVVKEQSPLDSKRFWVYKAPLKSVEAAQAKALELKALGIQDLYIVQEPRWKNAISFGVFEDEQLATNLLNELKAKGVKEVVKALRNQGKGHASLQFNKLTDTEVIELKKLKPEFPEADLKEVACS
ncbi:SPOR domain-containing protein [Methylotenera sp.]|uniref:SPOR domain-containing protein n=1 Tax=Methylotenera sp. TaxID=2051956 RepID=UPI00248783C3|nr:SPOR domain-containing protein [Methylotenera sp.]MDI1298033.1 SPOR domain-containing protein [Methylotenera sp.]